MRWNCLSIHVAGFHPVANVVGSRRRHKKSLVRVCGRAIPRVTSARLDPVLVRSHGSVFHRFVRSSNSRSSGPATADADGRLLLESLILAQDERWRHA